MITCFMICQLCQIVERVGVLFHNSCYVRERETETKTDREADRQSERNIYINVIALN